MKVGMHELLRVAVFLLSLVTVFWLILAYPKDGEGLSPEWAIKEMEILDRFIRITKHFREEAERIEKKAISQVNGFLFCLSFVDIAEEMEQHMPCETVPVGDEAYRFIQASDGLKKKFSRLLKVVERFASCDTLSFEEVTQPEQIQKLYEVSFLPFINGMRWVLEHAKQCWKDNRKEQALRIAEDAYKVCGLTIYSPYQCFSQLAIAGMGIQKEALELLEKWQPGKWEEERMYITKRSTDMRSLVCSPINIKSGILAHYWLFKYGNPYWLRDIGAAYLALIGWARECGVNIEKARLTESKIQLARKLVIEVLNAGDSFCYTIYRNSIFKGLLLDDE